MVTYVLLKKNLSVVRICPVHHRCVKGVCECMPGFVFQNNKVI